jgi:hypothetical protein
MTARTVPSAPVTELTEQARSWHHVSLAPHSAHAVAFRLADATIGVLHHDGLLEMPVPLPIGTILVEENLALAHPDRPDAHWVSTRLDAADVGPATLLLRLSYLYRRLLRSPDPTALQRIRTEINQYTLPPALVATFDAMLAKRHRGNDAPAAPPIRGRD